jgi:signal-transduction protein with cAMP-binding, CBS, and nucleotidyltransferase domain
MDGTFATKPGPDTPISKLHLRSPVREGREATIRQVAARMRSEDVSSVVIDTEPPSIITERDLTRALAEGIEPSESVMRVATRAPVWVPPTTTVVHAAATMVQVGMRHMLVLASTGEPVGVLSMRDLFEILLRSYDGGGWLVDFAAALGAP